MWADCGGFMNGLASVGTFDRYVFINFAFTTSSTELIKMNAFPKLSLFHTALMYAVNAAKIIFEWKCITCYSKNQSLWSIKSLTIVFMNANACRNGNNMQFSSRGPAKIAYSIFHINPTAFSLLFQENSTKISLVHKWTAC